MTAAELREIAKKLREAPQMPTEEIYMRMAIAADEFYKKYPCKAWEEAKKKCQK